MLALRCLVYFAEHESRKFRDIVSRQRLGDATQYPLGIAAINVACMLGDLFGIREPQFNPVKAAYWDLFTDGDAFFEMFSIALSRLDNLWTKYVVSVDEFAEVLQHVKDGVNTVLEAGPATVRDFQAQADEVMPL